MPLALDRAIPETAGAAARALQACPRATHFNVYVSSGTPAFPTFQLVSHVVLVTLPVLGVLGFWAAAGGILEKYMVIWCFLAAAQEEQYAHMIAPKNPPILSQPK